MRQSAGLRIPRWEKDEAALTHGRRAPAQDEPPGFFGIPRVFDGPRVADIQGPSLVGPVSRRFASPATLGKSARTRCSGAGSQPHWPRSRRGRRESKRARCARFAASHRGGARRADGGSCEARAAFPNGETEKPRASQAAAVLHTRRGSFTPGASRARLAPERIGSPAVRAASSTSSRIMVKRASAVPLQYEWTSCAGTRALDAHAPLLRCL
ncbi:hypothetical protein HPB47_023192 [Ixodes persulcatus]|uniref:Uncharacterized protein n=1 Tax=Ixodes persulcatus TaxID=34615 RepID=A0AC60Q7P1_IXOPE|nr:hypothetical protein HPB47_023192 [Ixodes persulcatus]